MGLLDVFKKIFNKITGKNNLEVTPMLQAPNPNVIIPKPVAEEPYTPIELPENEIVPFSNEEVLDADSRASEDKLKHNLDILIKQAKEKGKLDKFMIIREDNFFPHGWQWDVLSKDTNIESKCTKLSLAVKMAYAMRDADSKMDRTIGNLLLPSRFRSTKHFTVNTPLEITGDYNLVEAERDYIIIDNMSGFLNSGYAYSAAYHDAYLDVSHESLPISEEAVVLIKDENYERIMSDPDVANELKQRKVIRYKGETCVAINMVLTEMGVLPSKVGSKYAFYDQETKGIIDNSIKSLAKENGIFFDKSHGGLRGHFTSYYDEKNDDYQNAVNESIEFFKAKFPEHKDLFEQGFLQNNVTTKIIDTIGMDELLSAINEYNDQAKEKLSKSLEQHKQDRASITPEMHEQFTQMVRIINEFYSEVPCDSTFEGKQELENEIQTFFQGDTPEIQVKAAKSIWKRLRVREVEKQTQNENQNSIITQSKNINNNIDFER